MTANRDRWPLVLVILLSGLVAARVATLTPSSHLTVDDGYYYLGIAQNLAHGLGSTWDGRHPTNGYHPLWLLGLVPIFWLAPSPELALRAVFALQAVFLAAAAALLYLVCRRCSKERSDAAGWAVAGASSVAVIFWLGLDYRFMFSGLEYGVSVVVLLSVVHVWLRLPRDSSAARGHLALGLLLALAFMARIEALLLAGTIVWSRRRQLAGRPGSDAWKAALVLPVLVVAAGYAVLNWRTFGHPLPISGGVKAGWSQLALADDRLFLAGGWLAAKAAHLFWPLHPPLGVWNLTISRS